MSLKFILDSHPCSSPSLDATTTLFNKIHDTLVFWVIMMVTNVNIKLFYLTTDLIITISQMMNQCL